MNGSLYLSPKDINASPDNPEALITILQELEIIGPAINDEAEFAAGEGFPRHVVFAGCSPYLRFEPETPEDKHYCHVALHGPFKSAVLVTGENTVKPRCPHCRKRFSDWKEQLEHWQTDGAIAHCHSCNTDTPAIAIDWRQHAAAGRYLIELRNVFPGEASPSDNLIAALKKATGLDWQYAWAGMRL